MRRKRQNGEGGISAYQTKAGTRYRIAFGEPRDLEHRDSATVQRSKEGFVTREEATQALRHALNDIEAGQRIRTNDVTVAEYLTSGSTAYA